MLKSFSKSILTFILCLLVILSVYSNIDPPEKIINYLQNNFKIKNQVWGIETDQTTQLVYFATNTGLLEFDGLEFTPQKSKQIGFVRSIKIDTNNILFSGGFETFGYWERDALCNLKYFPLSDSISMNKNDEIWKIYTFKNEVIFQSFTSIYIYDYKKIEKISAPGFMLFMFKVNNQLLVQILDKGLYIFKNHSFELIEGSQQFKNIKIHSIIPFTSDSLLICTDNSGIYKYQHGQFDFWDSPISEFLKFKTCNAAMQLSDSSYAFGTILDGIVFSNKQGQIEKHYNYENGLNNNTVLSLNISNSKGLWIGLDEGVNYINQSSNINYFSTSTGSLGTIYSLLKQGNNLYFGSNHGLFKSEITQISNNLNFSKLKFIPNSQGQVWSLANFEGEILCGHNEGTFRVENSELIKINDITGGWIIKPYGEMLIEGTYTGLITYKKNTTGNWAFKSRIEGYYEPTRHLEVDYLGYIWVSHPQKGIFRLRVNESKDSITDIHPFTQFKKNLGLTDVYKLNNRVVFLSGTAFFTYDYVNDSIVPFYALNNSLGEYKQASQILPFEKNQYWFVYKNKLALFSISIESHPTKIAEFVIVDSNMPGQDLAIIPLNDSDFFISNRNGLALLKRINDQKIISSSDIFIKNAIFHGKNKSVTFCCSNQPYVVPFNMNNVTFSFSDPSSIDLPATIYNYKINEIDENWITTDKPELRYYQLKPGNYHLEICSDTNPKHIIIEFTITPPWYQTSWFYLIYLGLALILAWLLYQFFKNKLARQHKLLEFEVKQTSLENRLQNTNVELMLTLRYLIQKNESLQNLQNEINAVKESPGNIPIKFIRRLDTQINKGLELQTKEWKMALNNLKLSQEGYFKKLKENYPRLTNNDIRLCSYLRMNFSSKEIAHLLNISTRAVDISRYRLRKKLALEHNKNLTDFLMQDEF